MLLSRALMASFASSLLAVTAMTAPASATAADHEWSSRKPISPSEVMTKPDRLPDRLGVSVPAAPTMAKACTRSASQQLCVEPAAPSKDRMAVPSSRAVLPYPDWCTSSTGDTVSGSRTEACRISGLLVTTTRVVNGSPVLTGSLNIDVWDYSFSDANLPNWQHQIGLAPWSGWGDAAASTVTGTGSVVGECALNGTANFPVQSMSPQNGVLRSGEFGIRTTVTAVGDAGACTTTWNLVFTTAGYSPATTSTSMDDVMCDNATGANGTRPSRIGCVVWWFPARVTYSQSRNPSLASHVARAQGSGLPGATFADPLNRLTSASLTKVNRDLACGDAPSIDGRSCDEYPLASTHQGLAFGGTRRTFAGCEINAPRDATGPTGASACMINKADNDAQGGIMARFYYDNRVLEGDPFRVGITS